jgi:hypothetical protein
MSETKICKYCKSEIAKDAKICPNCRKKQKGSVGKIIIGVIVVLVLIGIIGGNSSKDDNKSKIDNTEATGTTEATDKTEENADNTEIANDGVVEVGGTYEDNGLKFTVNSATMDYQVKDEYGLYKLDDGLVYLLMDFTFENTGDNDKYVSVYDFKCYADNTACEQKYVTEETGDFINTNLSAGRNCSFKTLYAVPADATSIELEYESNIWTNEKVKIKIK